MTWQVIPNSVKNVWEKWNIRGVILFSLTLQIILILFAPLRKRTQRSILVWFMWSAYLLADWAVNFCVGLISNNQKDDEPITSTSFLLAFWAPFLLLHLGGPDTITAFALEDNELWLRHLLGLVFQVIAVAYVFLLTVPDNTLWIPTLLVFLAGIIKYAERTRSLYLASINSFRQSIVPKPDPGPNYAKLMEEYFSRTEASLPARIEIIGESDHGPKSKVHDGEQQPGRDSEDLENAQHGGHLNDTEDFKEVLSDLEVLQNAYDLFDKFKGLIADMIFSISDRDKSREIFREINHRDALRVIEAELNFIYEVFYTKVSVVRNNAGYFFRVVSFSSVVAAMVLFILEDKHDFHKFDVRVTYTLLYGALALDIIAIVMLIFSDRTLVSTKKSDKRSFIGTIFFKQYHINNVIVPYFLSMKRPKWSECKKQPYAGYSRLSTRFPFRRWSGSMSGHNFISYCLDQCPKDAPPIDARGFRVVCQVIKFVWFKVWQFLKNNFNKVVDYFGAKDLIETWRYKKKNLILEKLWKFIFVELKKKSEEAVKEKSAEKIYSARGEYIIGKLKEHKDKLMQYVNSNEVAFDESLVLWHIATHLCYEDVQKNRNESDDPELQHHIAAHLSHEGDHQNHNESDNAEHQDTHEKRLFSKLISDYMLYLLIMQPTMMSSIAGIAQIRFQDTRAETIKFFSKRIEEQNGNKEEIVKAACKKLLAVHTKIKPVAVKGDRSKSVLFDACMLAKELNKLPENLKWRTIAQVWVEILSYAATNCRPTTHLQQVSKGGELISFVWLLMVHLGLGAQFQIKEGHARAKLIVGK